MASSDAGAATSPRRLWLVALEAFCLLNYAFLVLDIWVAHSVNRFRHSAEWVPLFFSMAATVAVAVGLAARRGNGGGRLFRGLGYAVGVASIAVGMAGTFFHLESQFFAQWTIHSLVYTAPFVAPLTYAGLGLLLLLNRMAEPGGEEWSRWVIFLGLGGFVGNFVLSLCDHAQNGFFHTSEWIPVAGSALAVGFLTVALWENRVEFLRLCLGVMILQAAIGVAGFGLHLRADVNAMTASPLESFLHGAPVFAPLLFANLGLLSGLGLWCLIASTGETGEESAVEKA